MGLLDDAIREHLALARRHGASPEEIARKEAEALGPVRRVAAEENAPVLADPDADAVEAEPYDEDYGVEPAADLDDPGAEWDAPEYEPIPRDELESQDQGPVAGSAPADHAPELVGPPGPAAAAPLPPLPPAAPEPVASPSPDALTDPPPPRAGHDAPAAGPPPVESEPSPGRLVRASERPDSPPRAEEGSVPSGEKPENADVLEETPDFLQETPEHDRLWFEQKPPRDFDFDD